MFIIRKEQLEVFRAPLRQKRRDELLLNLQSTPGNKVVSQKDKIEVADKKGRVSTLYYSEKNLLHAIVKPSGTRYEFDYNEDDRLSKVAFPGNESLVLTYRESLPTNVVLNGAKIELQYDAKKRLSGMTYPDKKDVQFQYHDNNQIAALIDRVKAKQSYDTTIENNRLVHRATDALGRETAIFMNTSFEPEKIVFPDKSRQEIRYDEILDAEITTSRNGTEKITYFEGEYAKRIEWADGGFHEIELNDEQQVALLENATGTLAYSYDENGRLLNEAFQGWKVQYEYEDDYLKRMIYPGGLEVAYEYDEDERLKNMRVGDQTCSYSYAPNGTLAEIHYPNGLTEHRNSRVLGGLQNIQLKTRTGETVYRHYYQYDNLSRLTVYQEIEPTGQPVVRELSYDDESRLTQITERATWKTEHFRYDLKGNIIKAGKQQVKVGMMDEVRSIGGEIIEYDKGGNITGFTDNEGRRLRLQYADDGTLKLARMNGETWEYWYDALGRRVEKSNGKVAYRFFWSGKKLISEEYKDGDKITLREYIYTDSDVPVAFREGSHLYWLQQDVRGAITRVYDSKGTLVWKADYTAFGKAIISLATVRQPWRLMGQYHDEESGLHYNFARYYSPLLRTFLSVDPLWDVYGARNYSYAANDPYNKADDDGYIWHIVAGGVIGGVIGGVVGAVMAPSGQRLSGALHGALQGAFAGALTAATGGLGLLGGVAGSGIGEGIANLLEGNGICLECIKNAMIAALAGGVLGAIGGKLLGPILKRGADKIMPQVSRVLKNAKRAIKYAIVKIKPPKVIYDNVYKSASIPKKGTTELGHALNKHAGRKPDIWGPIKGNDSIRHSQATKHFDDIMNAPGKFKPVKNEQGIMFLEKQLPDGRGIRLNLDGTFKGFIE